MHYKEQYRVVDEFYYCALQDKLVGMVFRVLAIHTAKSECVAVTKSHAAAVSFSVLLAL